MAPKKQPIFDKCALQQAAEQILPPVQKSRLGRPTTYNPEAMLPIIDEVGSMGGTRAQIAQAIGVSRETLNIWEKTHPDFSDAIDEALARAQFWWEEVGRLGSLGLIDGFNSATYALQMKNRFKGEWQDTKQSVHTGMDNKPIQFEHAVTVVPEELDEDELEVFEEILLKMASRLEGKVK